ncbi:uncharacterized protein LOC126382153 [Pectinophora gossypiella]|uniref:uncharacterized protein LOC126382153 n=1 Tax=Pectinophora gossypiella TaxID=13191 RepID=UPI00214E8167|nr:uncharacterized protein LOC126382153 [Pectinophora gossypiella]
MPFKRVWDASCPREYDRWEEGGVTWVIQDLPPEDDDKALTLMMNNLIPDGVLCAISELDKDPVSVSSIVKFWQRCLRQRMSLACYAVQERQSTLVALNCCIVQCAGEQGDYQIEGEAWKNVYSVLKYIGSSFDVFKYLGLDKVLYALGLVVQREYRGAKLGARLLAAREPLGLAQGIKGTANVFTGPASQKSAARAGFETAFQVTLKQLADIGLKYPPDDRVIKLMVRKYI